MMARAALHGLLLLSAITAVPASRAFAQATSAPAGDTRAQAPRQAQSQHGSHEQEQQKPPNIPPITDADRQGAFPEAVRGHAVHDSGLNYFVLFDQLEWQSVANGLNLDTKGWVGGDRDRMWFRVEGDTESGRVDQAEAHVLYARAISRWWDLVAGVRQDVRPGPSQTWAAVGVQGLAPYWFEVEATAYIGESAQTHIRLEAEYELLFTNRLILQPLVELEIYGKSIPERRIGAGLSTAETGVRLRYEIRRELAPYVGVTWNRKFGGTADFARAGGGDVGGARLTLGLRTWF